MMFLWRLIKISHYYIWLLPRKKIKNLEIYYLFFFTNEKLSYNNVLKVGYMQNYGIITLILTPFNDDESLNLPVLELFIDRLVESGI